MRLARTLSLSARCFLLLTVLVVLAPGASATQRTNASSVRRIQPLRGAFPPSLIARSHALADQASRSSGGVNPHSRLTATVGTNFQGVPSLSPFVSPSDSTGAAGPHFLLGAVNVHIEVLDRSG